MVSMVDLAIQLTIIPPVPALPPQHRVPLEDEMMVWISLPMGGSRWSKLSSALRYPHVLPRQTED